MSDQIPIERIHALAMTYLKRHTNCKDTCQEVAQATTERAVTWWSTLRDRNAWSGWVVKLACTELANHYRRERYWAIQKESWAFANPERARGRTLEAELPLSWRGEPIDRESAERALRLALARLDEKTRALVQEWMDGKREHTKLQYFRARARLRQEVGKALV